MEFSRQEYWSGLPFPTPEAQTHISCVSCIGRQILYHCTTWIKCGIAVDMWELLFTRLAKYSSIPRFLPFLMSEMNIEFCENLFWYLIIVFPLWPTDMINYVNRFLNIKWFLLLNHPWFPGIKSLWSWWITLWSKLNQVCWYFIQRVYINISKWYFSPSLAIVIRSYQQTRVNLTKEIRTHCIF